MTHALHFDNQTPTSPAIYQLRERAPTEPVDYLPITAGTRRTMTRLQKAFDQRFPPIKSSDQDVLILNWAEIERQFLDLCAPWDQQAPLCDIRRARQLAALESPEKTIRWLMVLSHTRTNIDTPEPRWGTGESYPMP